MNTKKETSMMLLSTFRTSQPMTTVLTSLSKTMMTRLAEQSLADALITDTVLEDEEVTWGVVDQGTNRRCRKLVSSDGYTYTVKGSTKTTTTWRCSVRNKKVWCRASVSQRGDVFTCGTIDHVHGSDNLAMKRVKVKTQILTEVMATVHTSAATIMEDVLSHQYRKPCPTDDPATGAH
ncbi:uncharacterized protein LOC110462266 isoform X3 [Mizuhopecten yessoensis]|uniref:uncharacterized protein LOC110462266 isoform X3 n=1 Tax=Mizuhopecten yessoensis TaxID=6573 RepID=UPI000B45DB80|nr:uncharacterized protein LOC110462266 isoform X3 [Mizuhopecten yessoensis]XP_021371846.1 uncharacterized protein LOC110462266 isoform X3 [Mizuhopecten yessoensis]XP_021371847.1 uncharacterized protein LOC110462266 isoform X3 [Mizuhopecten yessoensis]